MDGQRSGSWRYFAVWDEFAARVEIAGGGSPTNYRVSAPSAKLLIFITPPS